MKIPQNRFRYHLSHFAKIGTGKPRHCRAVLGTSIAIENAMETQGAVALATEVTFQCRHCNSPLVAGAAAAGRVLDCGKCGKPVTVPPPTAAPSADQSKIIEVQNRLKENESQRTEITGYINQSQIQLHRWQLRLQTLNERKAELEAELRKIT